MSGICELCGREVSVLTKHHLIPKARHSNKRNQRAFDRQEVKQRLAWFCRPCHTHVHALFTEKTLERERNTLALLAANSEVAKFVSWIRSKPDGFKPTSQASKASERSLMRGVGRFADGRACDLMPV